jgi:hypothetical protein
VASVFTVLLVGWDPPASPPGRLRPCRRPTTTKATSIATTPAATSIATTPAATSNRSRPAVLTSTPDYSLWSFRQIVYLGASIRAQRIRSRLESLWWKGGPSPSAVQDLAVLTTVGDLRWAQRSNALVRDLAEVRVNRGHLARAGNPSGNPVIVTEPLAMRLPGRRT